MKNQVVITSYGIVSSIGLNVDEFEKNLFAGNSGVKSIRGVVVGQDFPVPYAAWIPREDLPPSKLYTGKRFSDVDKAIPSKHWSVVRGPPQAEIPACTWAISSNCSAVSHWVLLSLLYTKSSPHWSPPRVS